MFKTINNKKIYFHNFENIDANKKSLLFIPGAGLDYRYVRALKFDNTIFNPPLVIDFPGHGKSEGKGLDSIEAYSQFMMDALEDWNFNDLHIFGHSMGGLIGLDLLNKLKISINTFVMISSIYPIRVADSLLDAAKSANSMSADFIIKYGVHKRLIGMKNVFPEDKDMLMFDDLTACNNYHNDLSAIRNSQVPITIINGDKDKLINKKHEMEFLNVTCAKKIEMKDVGHFPFFEDPNTLSDIIAVEITN